MKLSDVRCGETYLARVSGELVRVTVLDAATIPSWRPAPNGIDRTPRRAFRVRNERTGKILKRSAAALREDTGKRRELLLNAGRVLTLATNGARAAGAFDRCEAYREITRAVAREHRSPSTGLAIALGAYRREFGALPDSVSRALEGLGVGS
jgi:hypothetical protein